MQTPMKPTRKQRAEMREEHAAKPDKRTPSQLTEDEVRAIRAARAAGTGALGLALQYNVRVGAVYEIHKRRARADVPAAFETEYQRQERERKHKENLEMERKRAAATQRAVESVIGGHLNCEAAAVEYGARLKDVRRAVREARAFRPRRCGSA